MPPLMVVDAFTDEPFGGNPAAVCVLDRWPGDRWLQRVAREMNLSETAFLVRLEGNDFDLRWLTPTVEVQLCGHATLASAHALWEGGFAERTPLEIHTMSGRLTATLLPGGEIELDFPAQPSAPEPVPAGLFEALGIGSGAVERGRFDIVIELANEAAVCAVKPDFAKLGAVDCRGVIITARSDGPRFDFVSRFFGPRVGVNEDPVTGSAHCCLAEYWGGRLNKATMLGYQASERGGAVRVTRRDGRVLLGGRAVTVTAGDLKVSPE
jgi:PhzF family phenazine biosynthesis protein